MNELEIKILYILFNIENVYSYIINIIIYIIISYWRIQIVFNKIKY